MMQEKKRKFEPSEQLKVRLLELAGITVVQVEPTPTPESNPAPSFSNHSAKVEEKYEIHKMPSELLADAVQLKRRADKLSGAAKYLLYVRSGLKFLERAAILEGADQSRAYSTVGDFLSQCATHAERLLGNPGLEASSIEHLLIFSLQLSAIAYMRSFSNRSKKLKTVRDLIKGKSLARKQTGMTKTDDSETIDYFVEEFNDVLMALHLWKRSEELILEAETSQDTALRANIKLLPPQKLYVNNHEIQDIVVNIRRALEKLY